MTTTPNPSNVPDDIKKIQADEATLTTDTTTLAIDYATPPPPPPPPPPPSTPIPITDNSVPNIPSKLIFNDEFPLPTLSPTWAPDWYGDGQTQQGTKMLKKNVSIGSDGLELALAADSTGALVSTNPFDKQHGSNPGFECVPTPSSPVFIEYQATLPGSPAGQIANWPALWATGQPVWPTTGEIDLVEGLDGTAQYHIHYGTTQSPQSKGGIIPSLAPGKHVFGCLWSTTGVTFFCDGKNVGTTTQPLSGPMYLVLENALAYNNVGPTLVPSIVIIRYARVWQD